MNKTILAEKIYTVLLSPKWVRRIVHWLILRVIPRKVRILDTFDLILNPSDPVLSGAITFGVYEPFEQKVFQEKCREGFQVLDIGANVGLYTGIAATRVGTSGKVIAVEPYPDAFSYLEKLCAENHFEHVLRFNVAAGDSRKSGNLYLTKENRGDCRIYDAAGNRPSIPIKMISMDDLLREQSIGQIDLIKMDIQGAEGLALRGLAKTLEQPGALTIFSEFWPWGLRQAGTDPLEFLATFRDLGFNASIIDEQKNKVTPLADITTLIRQIPSTEDGSRSYANLIFYR